MKKFERYSKMLPWFLAAAVSALIVSCGGGGGGQDPILGAGAVAPFPPTVTAVAPVNNATGVPNNGTLVTAAFSKDMNPATINAATFTVACPVGAAVAGTVAYAVASRVATFTPAANLPDNALCTATVTTGATDTTGLTLVSNFVWTFRTGVAADTTRPRVTLTIPATSTPGPTVGVATNTAISAVFSEDIAPASVTGTSFTVTCIAPCVSPTGVVTYSVSTRSAIFTPATALAAGTTYTATVTTAVTDLVGNALAGNQAALPAASNYIWSFTTSAIGVIPNDPTNVSVLSTNPTAGSAIACPNSSVNATFNVPSGARMNPATVTTATFTVTGPGPTFTPVVASSVVLDAATGRIATFTPLSALVAGVTYTATVVGGANGVKDLAVPANQMAGNVAWNFTVVTCAVPPPPPAIPLGSASSFGTFGGSAGITNQGLLTVINGDIGTTAVSTAVTGFHDAGPGCTYTETPLNAGTVNGKIYTAAPPPTPACPSEGNATTFAIATQARADALAAYNALVAQPGGPDPGAGNLGSLVLAPGVYTAASGSFRIQGGNLTLDAQGNANAVWIFQMATTLTVGGPGVAFPQSITLANGAQAKNVFWQVGSAATINAGGGGSMAGTIIAQSGVTFSTAGNVTIATLNGRALSLGASVTMVNTVINVPAP